MREEGVMSTEKEGELWHIVLPLLWKSPSDIYNRECSSPKCVSRVLGRCVEVTHGPRSL